MGDCRVAIQSSRQLRPDAECFAQGRRLAYVFGGDHRPSMILGAPSQPHDVGQFVGLRVVAFAAAEVQPLRPSHASPGPVQKSPTRGPPDPARVRPHGIYRHDNRLARSFGCGDLVSALPRRASVAGSAERLIRFRRRFSIAIDSPFLVISRFLNASESSASRGCEAAWAAPLSMVTRPFASQPGDGRGCGGSSRTRSHTSGILPQPVTARDADR